MTAGMDISRILLIRLSALGDVVHTLPAAAWIKQRFPNAKLTWIVEPPFVGLLENNPVVDEVIVLPKKAIVSELSNPIRLLSPSSELKQFSQKMKDRKFTVALDFQGLFKSAFVAYLSGAPTRIGFNGAREFSELFMTHKVDVGDYFSFDTHVVNHNLALAEFLLRIAGDTSTKCSETTFFPFPDPGETAFRKIETLLADSERSDVQSPVVAHASEPKREVSSTAKTNGGAAGAEQISEVDEKSPKTQSAATSDVISQPNTELVLQAIQPPRPIRAPNTEPVAENLVLARLYGFYRDASHIEKRITKKWTSNQSTIVVIPGTTWITKTWPRDKWVDLIARLLEIRDARVVMIGGNAEIEMNSYIYDRVSQKNDSSRLVNVTGKTDLKDLLALFMMSDIVIGADTGPLHMAAGIEIPYVVGIYGSTPWKRNGPFGPTSSVVALNLSCQPCFEKQCPLKTIACLVDLEVDRVYAEIKRICDL